MGLEVIRISNNDQRQGNNRTPGGESVENKSTGLIVPEEPETWNPEVMRVISQIGCGVATVVSQALGLERFF